MVRHRPDEALLYRICKEGQAKLGLNCQYYWNLIAGSPRGGAARAEVIAVECQKTAYRVGGDTLKNERFIEGLTSQKGGLGRFLPGASGA